MRISLCIGALLIALLNPHQSAGQTITPGLDCQEDAACSQLKERAAERSKSGDLSGALRLYKQAYEGRADPRLLFNIARTLHKQGQTAEAVPYYQRFLDSRVQDDEPRQKAREYLKEIQSSDQSTSATLPPQSAQVPAVATADGLRTDGAPAQRPIYKKWWFWTAITGGVLAVTAIGLGVGLGLSSPKQTSIPLDTNTYEPRF